MQLVVDGVHGGVGGFDVASGGEPLGVDEARIAGGEQETEERRHASSLVSTAMSAVLACCLLPPGA